MATHANPLQANVESWIFLCLLISERVLNDEIKLYLLEKMDADANPLEWWKKNEDKYPKVAALARKILAISVTSVPSERIFSPVGLLINKLRNRLSSDLVDNIIFLNKNTISRQPSDCEWNTWMNTVLWTNKILREGTFWRHFKMSMDSKLSDTVNCKYEH